MSPWPFASAILESWPATWADTADLTRDTGFAPKTPLTEGIARWTAWFKDYASR
jgi:UDP-glucuronate 4-epimerase